MKKNKDFFKSFKNAVYGIITAFSAERNLRFHFMIANLIIIFAYFFGLSSVEWAVLFLSIALVFCTELINTSIENAVDTATREYSKTARIAKDTAAGAVLFAAIISIAVGFMLFFDISGIINTLTYIFSTPKVLIICLLIGIGDILFLIFGGRKKLRKENKNNEK